MAEKRLEEMTLEELEEEQKALNAERAMLKQAAMQVQAMMDRKSAQAEAQRKYEGMSAAEKAVLHQMIAANGVESGEDVGKPGA